MNKHFTEMTSAELVAEFNRITGQSVKRFSSRQDGLRRMAAALKDEAASAEPKPIQLVAKKNADGAVVLTKKEPKKEAEYKHGTCPNCGTEHDQTAAGLEGEAGADRLFCHHCSTEYFDDGRIYKAPAKSLSRSVGIANSWANPAVAAARKERVGCKVVAPDGKTHFFKSVPQAFKHFGLQWSKMFAVRKAVKLAPVAFNGYTFSSHK